MSASINIEAVIFYLLVIEIFLYVLGASVSHHHSVRLAVPVPNALPSV